MRSGTLIVVDEEEEDDDDDNGEEEEDGNKFNLDVDLGVACGGGTDEEEEGSEGGRRMTSGSLSSERSTKDVERLVCLL